MKISNMHKSTEYASWIVVGIEFKKQRTLDTNIKGTKLFDF